MFRLLGKLLALTGHLCVVLCVATCIALVAGGIYLSANGKLDVEKLRRLALMAQEESKGEDELTAAPEAPDMEQPSYEDLRRSRSLEARNQELREQAIKSEREMLRLEREKLQEERSRYDLIRAAFSKELDNVRGGALTAGREKIRQIWEKIEPKQAKEQIMKMLEKQETDEVVTILAGVKTDIRADIISQFKTSEEVEKLDTIMRLIRQGKAEVDLVDQTKKQIGEP